ncbi:MAG TPA: DNA methyltransferase [Chloroflexota bacterium]|nr:DNA methyltransferase [Chloroflexota bacterium]
MSAYDLVASPYPPAIADDLADVAAFVVAARSDETSGVAAEPWRAEVSGARSTAFYTAHSYPTKLPPEAIVPFLEHYSAPGDLVLDPFAGSGMTGVAACMTGRRAVLNDLSPLAVHLAYNHTTPCDPDRLVAAFEDLYRGLRPAFESLYWAEDGYVRHTLWSVVYQCPFCRNGIRYWDVAVDHTTGAVQDAFACPTCANVVTKLGLQILRSEPVLVNVDAPNGRTERAPTDVEVAHITGLAAEPIEDWYPDIPFSTDREMYIRCALHLQGIHRIEDFYTRRNLRALARIWRDVQGVADRRVRRALQFAFTNTAWHGTRMRRFNAFGGHRPLTGTLYIPQISSEANVLEVMRHKVRQLARYYAAYRPPDASVQRALRVGSAADLREIPDGSIDYAFFDPPFGANIFYADLNYLLEAWLGATTRADDEMVVNRSRSVASGGKTLADYERLLTDAFREVRRVLKPERWASVVFHNTDPGVWSAFQDAAEAAGFSIEGTSGLNRAQLSMKGYKGLSDAENVAHHDIVLHMRSRASRPARTRRPPDETYLVASLRGYLETTGGPRTTQYMHSLALRHLVGNGYRLDGVSYAYVRQVCAQHFEARQGGWYVRSGEERAPSPVA